MRRLILALVLAIPLTVGAQAPSALCAANKQGGVITVINDPRVILATTNGGRIVTRGIWARLGKTTILVNWDSGDQSVLDLIDFKPC